MSRKIIIKIEGYDGESGSLIVADGEVYYGGTMYCVGAFSEDDKQIEIVDWGYQSYSQAYRAWKDELE